MSVKNASKKIASFGGPAQGNDIIEKIGVNTRTGFIPQMRKVNQDSYCIVRDLEGQVPGLWTLGVMDGHGLVGHKVSGFCKNVIPAVLK